MGKGDNQLSGLKGAAKREAKAALVLEGRKQWWRELRKKGRTERSMEYAMSYKFLEWALEEVAAEAKFKATIEANPEPVTYPAVEFVSIAELLNLPAGPGAAMQPAAGTLVAADQREGDKLNGWPVKCEAEVYRYPVNKKMVVIQLDDGRQARLWNSGGFRWRLKSRVKVKLDSAQGDDAIYEGDFGE